MSKGNGGIPWFVWAIVTILVAMIGAYATITSRAPQQTAPQPSPPMPSPAPTPAPVPAEPISFNGSSYNVQCRDSKEGNSFTAIIQFTSQSEARWRYANSTSWNDELKGENLSPHRLLLSLSRNDPSQTTWDLQFSDDYRRVNGTLRFLQDNPPPARWREYSVEGSRLE